MKEIYGRHTALNLALLLEQTLVEYGIKHRLGYTMSDNASANDACVEALTLRCCPELKTKDVRDRRRLRCFGHIVNLCAGAFTRGYFVNEKATEDDEWKEKGALGKMCKMITWFRGSSQRKQRFANTKVGGQEDHLEIIEANVTRWNSFYRAAERFLALEERISRFWQEWKHLGVEPTPETLTSEDWEELRSTNQALKVFGDATLAVEGHGTFLSNWLSVMDALLDRINNNELTSLPKRRKTKGKDKDTDKDQAAYYLCVVLDPRAKMSWFHDTWDMYPDTKAAWVPEVQRLMLQVWDQEYRNVESTAPRAAQAEVLPSPDRTFGMFPRPRSTGACGQGSQQYVDHFRRYLEEDPIPFLDGEEFDPIQYWLKRRVTQPQLSQMALDVLACSPMSDDCERLFSSAKMLLSDSRSRLKMDIIEGGECLRQWLGVIDQDDADVRVLEEKARILQETALCESTGGVCDEDIVNDEAIDDDEDIDVFKQIYNRNIITSTLNFILEPTGDHVPPVRHKIIVGLYLRISGKH
ncbi:uncharacterized protein CPUR_04409 [Claviceps purpurea 20.1]|uniref:HAT C-terminal dimerisation domain-containing protein n=1 Tax=Claviceps purpurea (strain 20.1) TaxID=1111077 RepID=M1W145_CLAP2|nr:uncharacterized protein CPUR_04409 [Claviceps purpurea 20.1]